MKILLNGVLLSVIFIRYLSLKNSPYMHSVLLHAMNKTRFPTHLADICHHRIQGQLNFWHLIKFANLTRFPLIHI